MSRRNETGDGDICPLFPEHGKMLTVPSQPPEQYCPHVTHDGVWGAGGRVPPSRKFWPLYGFEESVHAYTARLDRAIREAGMPDLSDLEVK